MSDDDKTKGSAGARGDTAERILDLAETLIQTRGYSAFSYADIASALGIRKASIHYHFPSKTDLGVATIERYAARFGAMLERLDGDASATSGALLEAYMAPFKAFAETPDRVCLCGALAGEIMALPEAMRAAVEAFFTAHQRWLARILERGAARGEFRLDEPPARAARAMFGALQGALLVKRATGDPSQLFDVADSLEARLIR